MLPRTLTVGTDTDTDTTVSQEDETSRATASRQKGHASHRTYQIVLQLLILLL